MKRILFQNIGVKTKLNTKKTHGEEDNSEQNYKRQTQTQKRAIKFANKSFKKKLFTMDLEK